MRLLCLIIATAAISTAQNPIQWTLSLAPVKSGRATARLKGVIERGWYLYGLTQLEDGPKATRIWLPQGQAFQSSGELKSPKPLRKYDQNFNLDVEYYENEVTFQIPVRRDSAATSPLNVKVYFQSCNDKLCLPPRTVTVTAAK
jgi:thiol:disulfide interchange protein DsbD